MNDIMSKDDKDVLKILIPEFINSDETSMELEFKPMNEYCELLSELGFSTKKNNSINLMDDGNEWDTNGWQVDFWWTIFREGKKYMLAGSMFYGDIKLSKEDGKNEEE